MMEYKKENYHQVLLYRLKSSARPNRRKLRRFERVMQKDVDKELDKQSIFVIKESQKLLKNSKKDLSDDIDQIFDSMDDTALVAAVLTTAAKSMDFGGQYRIRKNKLAQFGISFDLDHPLAVEYLQRQRPLVLAKMSETTKNAIKPLIIEAVQTGASPQSLAKKISEEFVFSRERSLMIAVNEVGTAYENGNLAPIKDAQEQGIEMEKSWLTVGDAQVTPSHTENESDGWVPIDTKFTGTGDEIAPASDNPRCRCTILYRLKP